MGSCWSTSEAARAARDHLAETMRETMSGDAVSRYKGCCSSYCDLLSNLTCWPSSQVAHPDLTTWYQPETEGTGDKKHSIIFVDQNNELLRVASVTVYDD